MQRDFVVSRDLDRLARVAGRLALKAGRGGVTISDVRLYAEAKGWLTGQERGRRLSSLWLVMHRAGLVRSGEYRRSSVARSHRNLHQVWKLPEFAALKQTRAA